MALDVVIPPIPLVNTTATDLYNGLHHHRVMTAVNDFHIFLNKHSACAIDSRESDGATSNDKYNLFMMHKPSGALSTYLLCGNHRNQLIESHLLSFCGKCSGEYTHSLLNDLYASVLFVRSGGHFIRLLIAARKHALTLVVIHAKPPPHAALQAEQMIDYLICRYKARCEPSSKALDKYTANLKEFFAILNGPILSGLFHYSVDNVDIDAMRQRLADLMNVVLFARQPGVPHMNKWTKLGPAYDWLLTLTLFCIGKNSVEFAFDTLDVLVKSWGDKGLNALDDDQGKSNTATKEDPAVVAANWHKVAGRRLVRFKKVLACQTELFLFWLLAIVLEPIRWLTLLFMSFSNRAPDYSTWPPLFDLIWDEMSPLTRVLQYYATLLSGRAPRLILLFAFTNCCTFDEWCTKQPKQVWMFRRMVLAAVALVQMRHTDIYSQWPWLIYTVGDRRRPWADRAATLEKFKTTSRCCLPLGLARWLHGKLAADLASATWQTIFFFAAWELRLSISIIEMLHARNRRTADEQMEFHNFASRFITKEVPGTTLSLN